MTDEHKLAYNTAVELPYLTKDEQEKLVLKIKELCTIPSIAQALKLKKYSAEGSLKEAIIDSILSQMSNKPITVTLKSEK